LTEFFELASLWDAVLLVDEADIFMEARSLHELRRNAMVGVFLRVLEYQQQIMFLSTNRLNTFDEAFRSRISVAIQYHDLDESARRTVWENFLKVADVKTVSHISDDEAPVAYVTTEQLDRLASKTLKVERSRIPCEPPKHLRTLPEGVLDTICC
jgi:AAA+ superfamily predicted ATPase